GQEIFKSLGSFAPAMGMAGTLIGLIQMLQKLSDPSQIGGGMATAMITTFYGVLMANLLFLPMAGKLKVRTKQELLVKQLVIEAITSIQAGDNPRLLRDKLVTFIAPKHRIIEEGNG
ncbi:MotA/TolQ/ExbB proton channel family protein, partial [bacterium]|nr:MotA/TolQ/ExbB proton channel family protein [bacterium]